MSIWKFFAPKNKVSFYQLLIRQAEASHLGCVALCTYLQGKGPGDEVKRLEQEADDIRRVVIDELHKTFITPIDREDIFALSRAIDDVVDYAKNTVQEMRIFGVEATPQLCEMGDLLRNGSEQLLAAMRHLQENPNVAVDYAVRAKRVENAMNKLYLAALNELFSCQDIRTIFCMREIYRHVNRSADRVDEAANIITDIVMKMV